MAVRVIDADRAILDAIVRWFGQEEICAANLVPCIQDEGERRKMLSHAFLSPRVKMFGIESEDVLVGFCCLVDGGDFVQVPITIAEQSARGHGVATEALKQMFGIARSLGLSRLTQKIPLWNERMIRVSRRAGFVEDVSRRNGSAVMEAEV